MMGVGGQPITGTVVGIGPTRETRTMDPIQSEAIATVLVKWDDPALGTDRVAAAGLEVLGGR